MGYVVTSKNARNQFVYKYYTSRILNHIFHQEEGIGRMNRKGKFKEIQKKYRKHLQKP